MKTLLQLKPTKLIGQMALIALILFLLNPLAYAQTSHLRIQNMYVDITNEKGGLCGNVPQAYGTNHDGINPENFSINNVKNSAFLTKAFAAIPREKYFRAKARETLNITMDLTVPDTITGITTYKAQGISNVRVHLGYLTPDGFVLQETDPIVNFAFGIGGGGFGWGVTGSLFAQSGKNKFYSAAEAAFMVFSYTQVFVDPNTNLQIQRAISVMLPFIVEGIIDQQVDSLGIITEPQIPYMVLHDPPGDGSFTAFEEGKTACRSLETSFSEDQSNTTNASLKLGYAGSVGVIVVVDIEIYVEFSGSVGLGNFSMKSTSNESCLTLDKAFATSSSNGFKDGGDLFIGYGIDMAYGVFRQVVIDSQSCTGRIEKNLVYRPIKTAESIREFALDEAGIRTEIARLQKVVDDTLLVVKTRADADNQIKVWQQVIDLNEENKSNATVSIDPNITFGGGAEINRSKSMEVTESSTLTVENYIDATAGLQGVVNIGGSGFSAGYEYSSSKHFGATTAATNAISNTLAYTLTDINQEDIFRVDVLRDPMYGTPVFRLNAGSETSCPYEGGYQLDQPKLRHDGSADDHIVSQGNAIGSSVLFKIDLCNESKEDRTYNLALKANSNLNGAVVSAAGVPLNGNDLGQKFDIPHNSCLQDLIIEVKQLSTSSPLSYPNLELYLYSPCEEGIQSSVFASVYFGDATGVKDLADNNLLSVFPNPTTGLLQVNLPEGKTMESVRVMDMSGKCVYSIKLNNATSTLELNLGDLPTGLYVVQARGDHQVFVKQVAVN